MYKRLCRGLFLVTLLLPLSAAEYTLEDLYRLGLENSGSLQLKTLEIRKAGYSLKEAETRALPVVDLQATATLMSDPPEGITIRQGSLGYAPSPQSQLPLPFPESDLTLMPDTEATYVKVTATLTQPLFTWGKIQEAIKLARLDCDLATLKLEGSRLELRRDLGKIYHSLTLARDSLELLEQSRVVLQEILVDQQQAFKEGYINRQLVLAAEKNLASMELAVIRTDENYASGWEALTLFTGCEAGELITPLRSALPLLDEEQLKMAAVAQAPEYRSLERQLQQARGYLAIQQAGEPLKPDLSLVASLDITGQRLPLVNSNWSDSWGKNLTLTVAARMKLYDSGQARAKSAIAGESVKMVLLGLTEWEKGRRLEVRRGIAAVRTGYYALREARAVLEDARETYKNARVSFENELLTRQEERGARVLLYSREMEELLTLYNYELALIELEYLAGRPLEF